MRAIVLLISIFLVLGCVGSETSRPDIDEGSTERVSSTSIFESLTTTNGCLAKTKFDYPPANLEKIEYITPLGLMVDSHVTPVDHQYYQNFKEPEKEIEVYSPASGVVTGIQHMNSPVSDSFAGKVDDYRVVIDHACGLSSIYIHIGKLSEKLAKAAPSPGRFSSQRISVEAGEQIGSYFKNVDFNLVDQSHRNALLEEKTYEREEWKIHTPENQFQYFRDDIRNKMEEKSLRSVEPLGGKFDYDVDGRLVGNWFEEGTNGYEGNNQQRYWGTHLAIAYNHIDPSLIMVSLGTYVDKAEQFAVKGNSPDPATIGKNGGIVKYELVDFDYFSDGQPWDRMDLVKGIQAKGGQEVRGTVLLELIEDRKMKLEIFQGKIASEVSGFTQNAKFYER